MHQGQTQSPNLQNLKVLFPYKITIVKVQQYVKLLMLEMCETGIFSIYFTISASPAVEPMETEASAEAAPAAAETPNEASPAKVVVRFNSKILKSVMIFVIITLQVLCAPEFVSHMLCQSGGPRERRRRRG